MQRSRIPLWRGDDTLRRFFAQLDEPTAAEWVAHATQPLGRALPEQGILDWDSTVQPNYGNQEGAQRGCNPPTPGRRSFHPLAAVTARTRLAVSYHFRPGDTVTVNQRDQSMLDAQRWPGAITVRLNCGDLGLAHEKIMAWHEHAARPRFPSKPMSAAPRTCRSSSLARAYSWRAMAGWCIRARRFRRAVSGQPFLSAAQPARRGGRGEGGSRAGRRGDARRPRDVGGGSRFRASPCVYLPCSLHGLCSVSRGP